ncbi:TonB-dependent receptor [bacterium SCSIO 12696]|nr:TonB-dependent receptor [bacterium SCSIO 12696]
MNFHQKALGLAVVSTFIFPHTSFAKSNIDEEVITTATRTERPVSDVLAATQVFTRADIERLQPLDLPDLLNRASGVSTRDSGGRGSVNGTFIRGTSTGQALVLVNGVRTASATTGGTTLETIPLESIERIEIVKGPLSGLYGADALGGVIQIFTRQGQEGSIRPELKVRYGSNDTRQYTANISGGNQSGDFFLSVSDEETDGIDRTSIITGGNDDRDSFEEQSITFNGSYKLTDKLVGQLNYLRSQNRAEFDNTFGTDTGFFSDSEQKNTNLSFVYQANESTDVKVQLGYRDDRLVTPAFFSDITTRRNSFSVQVDKAIDADTQLSAGVDYYDDEVITATPFDETERDNTAVFVQWQDNLGDFSVVANLRYDDNQRYGNDTTGSLSVGYALSENLSLVASYGSAFRAPTFNELYFPGFDNPDLQPEESTNYELALRGQYDQLNWSVTAYRNSVDDLIGSDENFRPININSATLQGVEVTTGFTWGDWFVDANADYLSATDDATGVFLTDRARVSAYLEAGRDFGAVSLSVDVRAERGRHERGGQRLGGFGLLGAGAVYDITDQLKLSARVENLLDKDYTVNLISATQRFETDGRRGEITIRYQF